MSLLTRRGLVAASAGLMLAPASLRAAPVTGALAPDFKGVDSNGAPVSLSALRGRVVVLEWTNNGCPFVAKWYRAGAMQSLQRDAVGLGAVWISVISSAPGEQGWADGPRANQLTADRQAAPSHVVLDPTGAVGHQYGAETTPHLFVVGKNGAFGYMGGADSIASTRAEDLARAVPHARNAIVAIAAGQPAPVPVSRPYGCTIKYAA